MNAYYKKILSEYNELKNKKDGNAMVQLSRDDYGRMKNTLDFLEMNDYIKSFYFDNAYSYMKLESFKYFEDNLRAEIGEPKHPVVKLNEQLLEVISILNEKHQSNGEMKIYYNISEFRQWKNSMLFELYKLKKDKFITDFIKILDSFNGWNDEELLKETTAKSRILAEHIDEYLDDEDEGNKMNNKKVFIVHGHDKKIKDEVELFTRRIGLEPIILSNEASGGRTIIEKIEDNSDVAFAIVLYTACDEGKDKEKEELQPRARQNVVFEHGYMCGKLGRSHVVALVEKGVEIPGDLDGIVYNKLEDKDWKIKIERELKKAGIEADWTAG